MRESLRKLISGRNVIPPVGEAPALYNGVEREVERAAALVIHGLRGAEHLGYLTGDGDVCTLGMVDGVGRARLNIGVEHRVHRGDDALRGAEPGFGLVAVGRQRHNGVHREHLLLVHFRLTAGGEGQQHAQAEQHRGDSMKDVYVLHTIYPFSEKYAFQKRL